LRLRARLRIGSGAVTQVLEQSQSRAHLTLQRRKLR
jgi:hypothetical protein